MAISSGVGPHSAWLNCNGWWPIEHGTASLSATRKTSGFNGVVPMAWPGARAAFKGMDAGTPASIMVMARGVMSTLITGQMDETEFDYIPGRCIRFTGRDKSSALHEKVTSEQWLNKKPSEIVSDLIGRVGLSGSVTASEIMAGKQLQQDFVKLSENSTYAQIIHEMARLDGAKWWVDPQGKFHYAPLGSTEGTYSITIRQDNEPITADCLELKIKHNLQAARPVKVTVSGWHAKKRQIFSYTSNVEGRGPSRDYSYQVPTTTTDRATRAAKSEATERSRHEYTAAGTVVGDPSVTAGMGLAVSGTDFDQTYEIDHVQHEFGMSGFRTHITARSDGGRSTGTAAAGSASTPPGFSPPNDLAAGIAPL